MKKLKKLLISTVALFIMLLAFGINAYAEETPTNLITSSITIGAFESPKIGWAVPKDNNKNYFTVTGNNIEVEAVYFYKISGSNRELVPGSDKFLGNTVYEIEFLIKAKSGYYFSGQQKCYGKIDGVSRNFEITSKAQVDNKTTKIACTYRFTKTPSEYTFYGSRVGHCSVINTNTHDILGYLDKDEATATFNAETDTLYLNNCNIDYSLDLTYVTDYYSAASGSIELLNRKYRTDYNVVCSGINVLNVTDCSYEEYGVYNYGIGCLVNLNLSGDGTLIINVQENLWRGIAIQMVSYRKNENEEKTIPKLTIGGDIKVVINVSSSDETGKAYVRALYSQDKIYLKDNACLMIGTLQNNKNDDTVISTGSINEIVISDKATLLVDSSLDEQQFSKITYSGKKNVRWGSDSSNAKLINSGTNLTSNPKQTYILVQNKSYTTTLVEAKNTEVGIALKWNKESDATGYKVYRTIAGKDDYTLLKTIKANGMTTYIDTNAVEGVEYTYKVTTYVENIVGDYESAGSEKSMARVKTCKITSAKNVNGGVTIAFKKNAVATKYMVFRRTVGNGWVTGWTWLANTASLTYTDKKAESGKIYDYCVIPCKDKDSYKGYKSNDYQIKYIATPTVTVAKATNGIKVSWNKITGADKYQVFRRKIGNGWTTGWTWLKDTTGITYTDTTVEAGCKYEYCVKALSGKVSSGILCSATIKY